MISLTKFPDREPVPELQRPSPTGVAANLLQHGLRLLRQWALQRRS